MEGISHVRSSQETVPASSKDGEGGGEGGGVVGGWVVGGIGGKCDSNSPFCRYIDHIDFAPVLIKMIYSFIVIILKYYRMSWGQGQHRCGVCKTDYYHLVDLIAPSCIWVHDCVLSVNRKQWILRTTQIFRFAEEHN